MMIIEAEVIRSESRAALQAGMELVNRARHATSTHLIEILRTWMGTKPAVRLLVEDDELITLKECARDLGLTVHPARVRIREMYTEDSGDVFCCSVPWDDPGGGAFAAFLGPDETARLLADAESENTASVDIGCALGIPKCCTEAYRQVQAGRSWLDAWTFQAELYELHDPWSNHLASYLAGWSPAGEYLPCRPGCSETAALARLGDRTAQAFGLGDLRHRWREACARVVVVVDRSILFLPQPEVHDDPTGETAVGNIVTHGPVPVDLSRALLQGTTARIRGSMMEVFSHDRSLWSGAVRLLRFGEVGP